MPPAYQTTSQGFQVTFTRDQTERAIQTCKQKATTTDVNMVWDQESRSFRPGPGQGMQVHLVYLASRQLASAKHEKSELEKEYQNEHAFRYMDEDGVENVCSRVTSQQVGSYDTYKIELSPHQNVHREVDRKIARANMRLSYLTRRMMNRQKADAVAACERKTRLTRSGPRLVRESEA